MHVDQTTAHVVKREHSKENRDATLAQQSEPQLAHPFHQ